MLSLPDISGEELDWNLSLKETHYYCASKMYGLPSESVALDPVWVARLRILIEQTYTRRNKIYKHQPSTGHFITFHILQASKYNTFFYLTTGFRWDKLLSLSPDKVSKEIEARLEMKETV